MPDRMSATRFNRRRAIALGTIALIATPMAVVPTMTLAAAPATPLDQLMLGFLDGNGYAVASEEVADQYIDGVAQVELWAGIDPFLQSVQVDDILMKNTFLQNAAEYYQTGVLQRVNVFPTADFAATYLAGIYDTVAEEQAATGIGANLALAASLPDHDQGITGWTFDTVASDGGLLPSVRYLAQIDAIVVSVTVVSQNPATASTAALVLLEALVAAVRADAPPAPMLFPV